MVVFRERDGRRVGERGAFSGFTTVTVGDGQGVGSCRNVLTVFFVTAVFPTIGVGLRAIGDVRHDITVFRLVAIGVGNCREFDFGKRIHLDGDGVAGLAGEFIGEGGSIGIFACDAALEHLLAPVVVVWGQAVGRIPSIVGDVCCASVVDGKGVFRVSANLVVAVRTCDGEGGRLFDRDGGPGGSGAVAGVGAGDAHVLVACGAPLDLYGLGVGTADDGAAVHIPGVALHSVNCADG